MFRRMVVLAGLLGAAGTLGCGMDGAPVEEGDVEEASFALFAAHPQMWRITRTIPVCFKANGWNNWTTAIKDGVRHALTSTWGTYTQINFTGFGQCASSPSNALTFDQMSTGGGQTGFNVNQSLANITLNIPTSQAAPSEDDWNTFVHETGHAIGYAHEQERADNFDAQGNPIYCNRAEAGIKAGNANTPRTDYFDPFSMMNYCAFDLTNWSTNGSLKTNTNSLSYGDIRVAQAQYGVSDAATWIDAHAAVFATLH